MREITHGLPFTYLGRKIVSLLLGAAGGRSGRAFDVPVFETQKARLHPADNICEKRVFIAPQHWDPEERSLLATAIANHADDKFYFVDIGANAGLYTLFARSAALAVNKKFAGAYVEPDAEMRARAALNFTASETADEIDVFPFAIAAENGSVRFSINKDNRGMSRIDDAGEQEIDARTLLSVVNDAAFPRIDGLKVDIEGREFPALSAFFAVAPESLWPSFVVLETSHEEGAENASQLFEDRQYRLLAKTKLNSVYVR